MFRKSMQGKSSLLKKDKRKLTEIIVNYFIQHKTKISKPDFIRLSDEIVNIFPQELRETYFSNEDGKPAGILYSKYNNTLRTYRKNDQMESITKKRKFERDETEVKIETTATFSTEEVQSDEYVRSNKCENVEKFTMHWRISSKYRKHRINTRLTNISEILNEYKIYLRYDGYDFVSIKRMSLS